MLDNAGNENDIEKTPALPGFKIVGRNFRQFKCRVGVNDA